MDNLTLHQYQSSGNCYKVRLTAALLDLHLTKIDYNLKENETRTPTFLTNINASGRVPVLQIGKTTFLPESNAAITYLAAGSDLIPTDRLQHAEMLQWMFWEQYSHEPNIATIRYWTRLGLDTLTEEQRKFIVPGKRKQGAAALDLMDRHLATRQWFVGEKFSLADVALYAYTHVAGEGGFELERWPNVQKWCERVAQVPKYISIEE